MHTSSTLRISCLIIWTYSNIVLYFHHEHRSIAIWEENDPGLIGIKYHYQMQKWFLFKSVRLYADRVDLYDVSRLITMNKTTLGDCISWATTSIDPHIPSTYERDVNDITS